MGLPRAPSPVKFFVALLCNDSTLFSSVEQNLVSHLDAIDLWSEVFSWNVTDYYREEMGAPLFRKFVSFGSLLEPSKLAEIKLGTQNIEAQYRHRRRNKGERSVNLDPGYVEATKIVLASTKNAGHRVYLSGGIYAEATLQFRGGGFEPFPYTYPDYRWPETLAFFAGVRSRYLQQLREMRLHAG
jgi:hypothetical protein